MRQKLATGLGTMMIAGGLLGASLTFTPWDLNASAQEDPQQEQQQEQAPSEAHQQMDAMMDMMMGEGASDRMHQAMPGSEEMMEACASEMGDMAGGMMSGGMMNGMDNMDSMMQEATPNEQEGQ